MHVYVPSWAINVATPWNGPSGWTRPGGVGDPGIRARRLCVGVLLWATSASGPPSPSYPSWVWRTQVGFHRFREAPQPGVAFLAPGPESPVVLALSSRTAGRGLEGRPALFPPSLVGTLRGTAWDDPLRPTTSARWLLGFAVAAWLSRGPRCDCMHFATGYP